MLVLESVLELHLGLEWQLGLESLALGRPAVVEKGLGQQFEPDR